MIEHKKDDKLHCVNGPAIKIGDEYWYWFIDGKPHRYYGRASNDSTWWIHGVQVK